MKRFEHEGREFCEFRDEECSRMRMSKPLSDQLEREYYGWYTGVVSAFDGPNGTSWILELDQGAFKSVTAIVGYEEAPGFLIRPRPDVSISDETPH